MWKYHTVCVSQSLPVYACSSILPAGKALLYANSQSFTCGVSVCVCVCVSTLDPHKLTHSLSTPPPPAPSPFFYPHSLTTTITLCTFFFTCLFSAFIVCVCSLCALMWSALFLFCGVFDYLVFFPSGLSAFNCDFSVTLMRHRIVFSH